MNELYLHETSYRGQEALVKLGRVRVSVCGAGALGSLLADNLVRQGVRLLTVIDDDRVEVHNVNTQLYGQGDVGAFKANVLRTHLFRAAGVEITGLPRRLESGNVKKLLRGADLVVDTFDNSASRRVVTEHCREHRVACLHLGMNADFGNVRWNDRYRVPGDAQGGDVCQLPLARNLILLVVAAGSEAVVRHVLNGRDENYTVTLRDLRINPEPE